LGDSFGIGCFWIKHFKSHPAGEFSKQRRNKKTQAKIYLLQAQLLPLVMLGINAE